MTAPWALPDLGRGVRSSVWTGAGFLAQFILISSATARARARVGAARSPLDWTFPTWKSFPGWHRLRRGYHPVPPDARSVSARPEISGAAEAALLNRSTTSTPGPRHATDRKSTRLNSSHIPTSYALLC